MRNVIKEKIRRVYQRLKSGSRNWLQKDMPRRQPQWVLAPVRNPSPQKRF